MDEKDVLFHYGVKGMRWGVRKKRKGSSISGRVKSAFRKVKKKVTSKKEDQKSSEKNMDEYDEQLKKVVQRMTLEKQYRALRKELEPKKKTAGDVFKDISKVGMKSLDVIDAIGGAKKLGEKYDLTEAQTERLETSLKVLRAVMK